MISFAEVVEDAKQNFASASPQEDIPLPPLPAPLSRNASQSRTSRLPRRILAASQIFQADENGNITQMVDQSMASNDNSVFLTANELIPPTPAIKHLAKKSTGQVSEIVEEISEGPSQIQIPEIHTPSRQRRRATVSIGSPTAQEKMAGSSELDLSPSKRKEKSKSQSNIFQMHIAPISMLEAELAKSKP
ncbi:hypothetical protein CPB83DRAFT_545339 [Crepidotus variabilis]|uniref:Uncharacterized protein n=1 Tax=Crepidotus variabilis TaxID=179855 RepID=A0A9P6EA00_9AGAR|nr:hypothetical protein CPB83DRAFT_545339 [Crepidotus variabilis]